MVGSSIAGILLSILGLVAAILVLIFVLVPLLKGVGFLIGGLFKAIGWIILHVFEFVGGMIGDTLRFIGTIVALVALVPLSLMNVLIGRWSAAGHFAESVKRECKVAGACLYRVALRRPLKLLWLHGILEGVEQRVPEAMAAAPTSDRPRRRVGQFPGYTIVGSLRGGGSGAKLYVAEPDDEVRSRYPGMPDRVVIKTFALSEGSSLPQIVRESRALECAKQLGLVFEHGMDDQRFFYVMPYHAGDNLGIVTRQLHGENDGDGLGTRQLAVALNYGSDLVATLATYHRGGLWHKDVKPENIIIHDGRAHLVDLGLVTPLRSAMTLTTHGTEYFRDPELVRQALRGVKVHQVNGAKFDIYAAGAVLYFVIENTFPAHGALSRFSRRSPDALRWIVRRAMADYTHRYETAESMLADLRHVAMAADPFAVRPAELPSMSGAVPTDLGIEEDLIGAEAAFVATAGSPPPPPPPPAPGAAGSPGAWSPARPAVAASTSGPKPRLRITNWWTGAYQVDDPGGAGQVRDWTDPARLHNENARRYARAARHHASELRRQVRAGTMSARRAAREQIKTARTRAREIRRRAQSHRSRAVAERQPSITLMALGLGAVLIVLAAVALVATRSARTPAHVYMGAPGETYAESGPTTIIVGEDPGRPLLLVTRVKNPDDPRVREEIDKIIADYRDGGYDVIRNERIVENSLRFLLDRWNENQDKENDRLLEDALEAYDFYGILHVTQHRGTGKVTATRIRSTREGADDRRYAFGGAPPTDLPYLLVNDHPTRFDPSVEEWIDHRVGQFEARGFEIVVDDDMEAAVRQVLPVDPTEQDAVFPARLHAVLEGYDLGGIVIVGASPGEGSARDRSVIRRIDRADTAEAESSDTRELPASAESDDVGAAEAGCAALNAA